MKNTGLCRLQDNIRHFTPLWAGSAFGLALAAGAFMGIALFVNAPGSKTFHVTYSEVPSKSCINFVTRASDEGLFSNIFVSGKTVFTSHTLDAELLMEQCSATDNVFVAFAVT